MKISVDVMENIYKLIDDIKKTEEYKETKDALLRLYSDELVKPLIREFNELKDIYEKYPTKSNASKLSKVKTELYNNPLYKDYIQKLNTYNSEIEKIEEKINNALFNEELKKLLILECKHDKKNWNISIHQL